MAGFSRGKGLLAERGCPRPARLPLVLQRARGLHPAPGPSAMDWPSRCPELGDAQHWVDSDRRNEGGLVLSNAPEQREVGATRGEVRTGNGRRAGGEWGQQGLARAVAPAARSQGRCCFRFFQNYYVILDFEINLLPVC